MTPPDLSADAPILDVLQPLHVNLLPMRREKTDEMLAHHRERFLRFRITQEPLLAQTRLDRNSGALAEADIVFVRLSFREQPPLSQQFGRLLARFETVESVEFRHGRAIDPAIRMEDIDHRQLVSLSDFKIHFVMGRRHLEHAGAELRIDRVVADNRKLLARERSPDVRSDQAPGSAHPPDAPQPRCRP